MKNNHVKNLGLMNQPPGSRTNVHSSLFALRALFISGWVISASARSCSIDWHTIDGGVYLVSGTSGQRDAGGPMTNGPYSLTGGFWVLPTLVQTPGAPTLHITNAAPGFTLQSTDSLSPTNWDNASSGTNNPATVPATLPARFCRLFKP